MGFSKNISVHVDEEVDVRIDSYNVIEFLQDCSRGEMQEILKKVKDAPMPDEIEAAMPVKTMDDLLKMELFAEAFKKYSLSELEEKLK